MAEKREKSGKADSVTPTDPQIGPGRVMPLGTVARISLSGESDLVIFGDTGHTSGPIIDALNSKELLIGIAEGGGTHFMQETTPGEARYQTVTDTAERLGLTLDAVDTMPYEEKLKHQERWSEDPSLIASEGIDFYHKRLKQDTRLAKNIAEALPEGEKGAVTYGASHFTLDEFPRAIAGRNPVKIDVYENRASYEDFRNTETGINRFFEQQGSNDRVGRNAPEGIYFIDTGTMHTTRDTPDWLKKGLEAEGAPAPGATPQTTAPVVTPPVQAPITP